MVTVAHLVENSIQKKPFLEEALARGIINYVALAETLRPEVEQELKRKVRIPALVMGLRRLAEKLQKTLVMKTPLQFRGTDITIKSSLFEVTIQKSSTIINTIKKLYTLIDFSKGDFLTITQGVYEITIISNQKYKKQFHAFLQEEKIIDTLENLAALTIKIPKEAVETVGFFYVITKALNWNSINIIEIVSTLTELTFIVREDDVSQSFMVMKQLL